MSHQISSNQGSELSGNRMRLESFHLNGGNTAKQAQYELIFSEALPRTPRAAFFSASTPGNGHHDQFGVRVIEKHASHLLVEVSRVDNPKNEKKHELTLDLDVLLVG